MHSRLLDLWGGSEGGGHRGIRYEGVEAAVQAVRNSYYDDPRMLAAAYAIYIVQGHVFMDGNKRTGSAAMLAFLDANNIGFQLSSAQVARYMIELQQRSEAGEKTGPLIRWLAEKI
jgi:death-on-curing protein